MHAYAHSSSRQNTYTSYYLRVATLLPSDEYAMPPPPPPPPLRDSKPLFKDSKRGLGPAPTAAGSREGEGGLPALPGPPAAPPVLCTLAAPRAIRGGEPGGEYVPPRVCGRERGG